MPRIIDLTHCSKGLYLILDAPEDMFDLRIYIEGKALEVIKFPIGQGYVLVTPYPGIAIVDFGKNVDFKLPTNSDSSPDQLGSVVYRVWIVDEFRYLHNCYATESAAHIAAARVLAEKLPHPKVGAVDVTNTFLVHKFVRA